MAADLDPATVTQTAGILHSTDFWYAVSCLLFVVLLARPIMRMINKLLDDRTAEINRQLEEARNLREEAQNLLATYKRKQRDALEEAEEILSHAKEEAQQIRQNAKKQLEQELKMRTDQAMRKIEMAESEAVSEVQNATADIAVAAAQQLIADRLDDTTRTRLAKEAIEGMSDQINPDDIN